MNRKPHSPEFKEQALRKVRERGSRTQQSVADELNICFSTLKGWLQGSTKTAKGLPGDVAVALSAQGQGIGLGLLRGAIRRTFLISEQADIRAMLTNPIDDSAVRFYKRFGFVASPAGEQQLLLLLRCKALGGWVSPRGCCAKGPKLWSASPSQVKRSATRRHDRGLGATP